MTQKSPRLPIRSRDERARDPGSEPSLDLAEASGNGAAGEPDDPDPLEDVRRVAESMGYSIRRSPRSRRPRPDVRDGRVPTTCRLHPEVRAAMEQASLELNITYGDMINAGVVMFLRAQELRVDVDLQQFLP